MCSMSFAMGQGLQAAQREEERERWAWYYVLIGHAGQTS